MTTGSSSSLGLTETGTPPALGADNHNRDNGPNVAAKGGAAAGTEKATGEAAEPLVALARFFTGPEVGRQSIAMSLGGQLSRSAEAFFLVREAFGIRGYVDQDSALERILKAARQ